MSDLPELEHLLISAAARRSRRRARRRAAGALAVVAAVVLALVVVPRHVSDDLEIPSNHRSSVAPVSPVTAVETAFGVFRRPATAADQVSLVVPANRPITRRVAQTERADVYLAWDGDALCLAVTRAGSRRGGVASCQAARGYLDGHIAHVGTFLPQGRRSVIAGVFPDGVTTVTVTYDDGERETYPVRSNGFAGDADAPPVRLDWLAPDGQPEHLNYRSAQPLEASDLYAALRRPARREDALPGLPGSRQVIRANSASAWLVPRRGAVCLLVRIKRRESSGCQRKLTSAGAPLVVAMPGGVGGRVVVAAFIDRVADAEITPQAGIDQSAYNQAALLWTDGGEARTLRYGDPEGRSRLAIPENRSAFVLNGRAESPTAIPHR